MSNPKPIGIFDSGIGGLTVAKAISNALPNESFIYFGDTAHFPYGDKSKEAICNYSHQIAQFLIQNGAKAIVIACNSASAAAYNYLHKKIGHHTPIIDVINPVVQHISTQNYQKIGIIGTKATIAAQTHKKNLKKISPNTQIAALATPLLAPMIEEGYFNNTISQTIINAYLSNYRFNNIQALILACTHYPLIKNEVEKYYKNQIHIIDTTQIVAQHLKQILIQNKLQASPKNKPQQQFFVSDYTTTFEKTTHLFYQQNVHLQKSNIFNP